MSTGQPHNPFSSHLVEPACGGYIFTGSAGLTEILLKLQTHHWRGELVGPHGAGKSTLLTDICTALTRRGLSVVRWQCNDRQRTLPRGWHTQLRQADVIAIDGAERLWPWVLCLICLATRIHGKGLIMTKHRRLGVGVHVPVTPNSEALAQKIAQLTGSPVNTQSIKSRLESHGGNSRELLFDLYMEYEK